MDKIFDMNMRQGLATGLEYLKPTFNGVELATILRCIDLLCDRHFDKVAITNYAQSAMTVAVHQAQIEAHKEGRFQDIHEAFKMVAVLQAFLLYIEPYPEEIAP